MTVTFRQIFVVGLAIQLATSTGQDITMALQASLLDPTVTTPLTKVSVEIYIYTGSEKV